MSKHTLCRIGLFYDGSYFTIAQRYFCNKRRLGWLSFIPLHAIIEGKIESRESGFQSYRIVYAAWFQGLSNASKMNERQLRGDRDSYQSLLRAGIEPRFLPMSMSQTEKGVDVALAIDALQVGLEGKIDVAVLVTGDGDFVPLVRALMKNGVRVMAVHFEYEEGKDRSYINPSLQQACNYVFNLSNLEHEDKDQFKGLFIKNVS